MFGCQLVAAVKSLGRHALLATAIGSILKLASDTSLPLGVRILAALLTCAVASAIVVYVYREGGDRMAASGPRAHNTKRAEAGKE
jgi:hypothetical protein